MTDAMRVVCRVPVRGEVALAPLLDGLTAPTSGRPFADDVIELASQFSQRLMADPVAHVHPELMTLGFFMRKAELVRMRRDFETTGRADVVRVPQGLVFHVPPANVDTIFMYSWLLSVVAGNANIVRLSSRGSPVVDHLCGLLAAVLDRPEHAALRSRVAMIQYGHDDAITAAISARAAMRVLWGGDASIAAIRRAPLSAFGRDLTFADRWSLLALGAPALVAMGDDRVHELADRIYNDLFWFDQLACSSPRLCLWVGEPATVETARSRLWPAVAAVVARRGYRPDVAARLGRELFIHRAVLDGWLDRKDQTLTHAGLARAELVALVERLGGRGLDRVVPVGQALQMARFWDGYDLASELVRHVHVVGT